MAIVAITVANMAISQTIGMVDSTKIMVHGSGKVGSGFYRL